jgi:hypothetical protein
MRCVQPVFAVVSATFARKSINIMSNQQDSRPAGARRVAGEPARPKWLLPLVLGIALLLVLGFLLSRCSSDDDSDAADMSTAPVTAVVSAAPSTDAATAPAPVGAGQKGTVVAAGVDLLAAATAANLKEHDGQQTVGQTVRVRSVPADEGFWVGTSDTDRLWVQLTGTRGESDYKVEEGDDVDFAGSVKPATASFAAEVGLTSAEGAGQLTEQGYYISVPVSAIKLSK